jgi:hypothetical protein
MIKTYGKEDQLIFNAIVQESSCRKYQLMRFKCLPSTTRSKQCLMAEIRFIHLPDY